MPEEITDSAPPGDPVPCVSNELSVHSAECIASLKRTPLIAAAARVTRDPSTSEDIVQSGLEKLLRRLAEGKLKNIRCLPAYALIVVRRLAFNHQNNRKRELVVKRFVEPRDHADDPADLVELNPGETEKRLSTLFHVWIRRAGHNSLRCTKTDRASGAIL